MNAVELPRGSCRPETLLLALLPVAVLLALFASVRSIITREPQLSIQSPSGRFQMQKVSLGPLSNLVYLRIRDSQAPHTVFRTPLFEDRYTDMRPHEDDTTVGTYWIDFDKQKRSFEIGVPEWRENWLNTFISNAPCSINEN